MNMMDMISCVLLLLLSSASNFREENADRFEISSARILTEGVVYGRRMRNCTHRDNVKNSFENKVKFNLTDII